MSAGNQEGVDPEKREVKLVEAGPSTEKRWKGVLAGEYDATFAGRPHDLRAGRAGARVIPGRAMPMIRGVTLTTRTALVRDNEDEVRCLLRGVVETIHFFLTQEERTKDILAQASNLELQNGEEVSALYDDWAHFLDRKPYPTLEAINNVFTLAVRRNPEIEGFNPLILWDTHYVRELDDSGFVDKLYSR